jgi:hypothetical protein
MWIQDVKVEKIEIQENSPSEFKPSLYNALPLCNPHLATTPQASPNTIVGDLPRSA